MEINNEVGLFHNDEVDISYHVLQFVQDPQRLIQISMTNKRANALVQCRCQWLIHTAELIPNIPVGEFTFYKTPLWVYVHLVYPILCARKIFHAIHSRLIDKKSNLANYLTDCKMSSQQYNNLSPLDAVIQYGCPILFEKILKVRFSKDAKKYTEIAEYEERQAHRLEPSLTEIIARSRNLNILKQWMTIFPTLPHSNNDPRQNVFKIIARHGSCEMMGYLLDNAADVLMMEDSSKTFTVVHYAAEANRDDMLEFLCKRQFDLNVVTDCGKTPLYIACQTLSLTAIRYLLRSKVDLNKTSRTDQCELYQTSRITPLSQLIFSQYSCDMKSKRAVIVDLILAGAKLDSCALMTLFDETFTIQDYVINSLFDKANLTHRNARSFIVSLMYSLKDGSLTINEAFAFTLLCKQFLHASREFPMRNTVVMKVRETLEEIQKHTIEKCTFYSSTHRYDRDEFPFTFCV